MKLTDTQAQILTAAAQHPEHLAVPTERLPAGARQKVAQALLKQELVIAVHRPACDARTLWPVDGDAVLLKITDEGLRAISVAPRQDEQSAVAEAELGRLTQAEHEAEPGHETTMLCECSRKKRSISRDASGPRGSV
jgi:hypothetical protein